ncbi:hypothetical protein U472_09695 [Orenia metallireducens]|uniref:Uncharacterized protein n=1 Tax=Orenia metallireducens TaxID=1413210 RepID=A0A1C0A7T1_9FIRM|nr:hypothetical protein [Orenia metallireducens]OCL26274.1 hypothetical protein U472_09695 [Orenia metallireducens]
MHNSIYKLPDDKQKLIEALINKIKSKYKNDIAVVVCYGSYITGSAYDKSDLDFFFIPKTNKGYKMNMQFIINDIGYDFWPLSWEHAERIANFEETIISIIAEGVVVYYSEPEDIKRFNFLKQRIKELTTNKDNENILINEAEKLIVKAKSIFFDMKYMSKEYETVDVNCSQILNLLFNVIAILNSTYIKKGVYNIENEVKNYSVLPEKYIEHFNLAIRSKCLSEKREFVKKIIINVDKLLQEKKSKQEIKISNKNFKGFYEEIKSNYNKLIHACNNKDYLKAFFTAHSIDHEMKNMLGNKYKDFSFPNLIKNIDETNYEKLKKLTYKHEEELVNLLQKYRIDIVEYENIDTFLESF